MKDIIEESALDSTANNVKEHDQSNHDCCEFKGDAKNIPENETNSYKLLKKDIYNYQHGKDKINVLGAFPISFTDEFRIGNALRDYFFKSENQRNKNQKTAI